FTEALPHTTRSPLRWLADAALPRPLFERSVAARARAYLELLVTTNANRLVNDLGDHVHEGRSALEREIATLLGDVCEAAQRALARAEEAHVRGKAFVTSELAMLDDVEHQIGVSQIEN